VTRVAAIVESRMSSRRLPGKNLLPILGRPMLSRLIERLKRCRSLDAICVATSTDASDDPIQELAQAEGVACHRGSLEDVLERTLAAARSVAAELVVEITGDCPLVDPGIVDACVARYERGDVDYLVNVLDRLSFPIGFDVQVFAVSLLDEVARLADDPHERANVTPYIYRRADRYRVVNLLAPPELDRPGYRLCVDYREDFELVTAIYAALYPRDAAFRAQDVIGFLDANPALAARNIGHEDAFEFPVSRGGARHELLALDGC